MLTCYHKIMENNQLDSLNQDSKLENDQKKGYLAIFFSQAFSLMGSSVVSFALIWYLTVETGSAIILSIGMFVEMVPMLLIAPFSGVLADRINKKVLLILPDFLQALAVVVLIYLFKTGMIQIWHVLVLLAIRGIAQAFQMPVNLTLPALMIKKDDIPRINALNSILNSLIFIISPAIGAVVLGFMQMGDILWIDVITYLPAQLVLLLVGIPKVRNIIKGEAKTSFTKDLKEGFSYIAGSGLMPLIITVAILSIFINPLFNLIPLFIRDVHSGGASDLALVEVAFQGGMFLSSSFLLLKKIKPTFRSMNVSIIILFTSVLLMALVPSRQIILLSITIFIIGVTVSLIDVQFMSLLQIIIPADLQGRVFSSVFTMMKSSIPIGVIILGVFADIVPIRIVFITTPLLAILVTILLLMVTGIRKMDEKFKIGKYEQNTSLETAVTS